MRSNASPIGRLLLAAALVTAGALSARAQPYVDPPSHTLPAKPAAPPAGGIHITGDRTTSFMWVLTDVLGFRWDISSNGTISDGSNDAYDTGMNLQVGDSSCPGFNTGRLSADGKEVEVGPWTYADLAISRRVFVNTQAGYCRWIDVFENSTASEVSLALRYYFNMGASTQRTQTTTGGAQLTEKDWGIVTSGSPSDTSRPSIVHVFSTPGAKFKPTFQLSQGNDTLFYQVGIKVPPRKAVALCFFEAQRSPYESAVKFLNEFNVQRELALVPGALRTILLNMAGSSLVLGDIELARTDGSDLVVLRNGDEIRGQITTSRYALRTGFGDLAIPAGEVVGLVSRSPEKDLVRLVLTGGQVITGELTSGALQVRLPGGTDLNIPARGLRQAAYRVTPEKPEEVRTASPMVFLRQGDRLAFDADKTSLRFATSHGTIEPAADDLRAIEMDTPAGGLHRAIFRNGSQLAGLLDAERVPLSLKLGGSLEVRPWQLARIVFPAEEAPADPLVRLNLRNADVLYGRFTDAKWKVMGDFGPVEVSPADVAEGEFNPASLGHVKVTLRNGTKIGGKLADDYLGFQIVPGPAMKVFIGKVDSFTGGAPAPGAPEGTTRPTPGAGEAPAAGGGDAAAVSLERKLKELQAVRATAAAKLQEINARLAATTDADQRTQLTAAAAALNDEINKLDAMAKDVAKAIAAGTRR